MNNNALRFLTWGTFAAALGSAVLLTGETSGLPDLAERRAVAGIAPRVGKLPALAVQRHAVAPARPQGSGVLVRDEH